MSLSSKVNKMHKNKYQVTYQIIDINTRIMRPSVDVLLTGAAMMKNRQESTYRQSQQLLDVSNWINSILNSQ